VVKVNLDMIYYMVDFLLYACRVVLECIVSGVKHRLLNLSNTGKIRLIMDANFLF